MEIEHEMNRELTAKDMLLEGDHMVKALALDGRVRGIALRAENTVRDFARKHDLSPLVTAAAGRLAMGAQLMSSSLKNEEDSLSIILRCDGEMQGMTVVSDGHGRVRGLVKNPHVETREQYAGKLAVGAAVGQGDLTVIKDSGLREPYVGTVPLYSGEIAEDLAAYLLQSEQIPTVLALGVKMNAEGVQFAGGLMIQLLPSATEEDLAYIEQRAQGGFPDITFLLEEGFSPAQILDLFFGDPQLEYLASSPVSYFCPCCRERMERNLLTLGRAELEDLAKDPQGISLACHFCDATYAFAQDEVKSLLD